MNKEVWPVEKLDAWRKFWGSEMGQEALGRMRALRDRVLNDSLNAIDPNVVCHCVHSANGIDLVIQDIESGIVAADAKTKKETEVKK